jgi:hypothetical protein
MPTQISGFLPLLEHRLQRRGALRRIGLDHAHAGEQRGAGGRKAPDHVGAGIVFLGDQLGRHDAGRIAHPGDLDVGLSASKAFLNGSSWSFSSAV